MSDESKIWAHIIPITYEQLPEPPRFLEICRQVVRLVSTNPTLKRHGVRTVLGDELTQYSPYLVKGVIPPRERRYNSMHGWLSVAIPIRWALADLYTEEPVEPGSPTKFPGIPEDHILIGIVPLSVEVTPTVWATESHFGSNASLWGSHLKIVHFIYHVRLLAEEGQIQSEEFKEIDAPDIANTLICHIAEDYLGISDVQMEEIRIQFGYTLDSVPETDDTFERLRVLYYGSNMCSASILKRSVLLFDDIHFHDRPSLLLGNTGIVGADSPMRQWAYSLAKEGVAILVHKPDSNLVSVISDSISVELEDPRFSKVFHRAFVSDPDFQNLFVQKDATYGGGVTGQEVCSRLIELPLGGRSHSLEEQLSYSGGLFDPSDVTSLEATFRHFLIQTSVNLSLCCASCHECDLIPFTEHPALDELLALRYLRAIESGGQNQEATVEGSLVHLGFRLLEEMIPRQVIDETPFEALIQYRQEMSAEFREFRSYLVSLQTELESNPGQAGFTDEIEDLIKVKVLPKADEARKSAQAAWEKIFGKITEGVLNDVGVLTVSYMTGLTFEQILLLGTGLAACQVLTGFMTSRGTLRRL